MAALGVRTRCGGVQVSCSGCGVVGAEGLLPRPGRLCQTYDSRQTRTSTAGSRSSALSASTVTVSFQPRWGIVAAKRCNSRMPSPGTARRCGFCGSCALDTQVPTHRRIADRAISSSGTTARSCQVLSLKQKCPESIIGPGTLAAVRTRSMPSRIDGIALAACIRRACPRLPP